MNFYAVIIHGLVTAYADDTSLAKHIEAVKRAWWSVVVDNSWAYAEDGEL